MCLSCVPPPVYIPMTLGHACIFNGELPQLNGCTLKVPLASTPKTIYALFSINPGLEIVGQSENPKETFEIWGQNHGFPFVHCPWNQSLERTHTWSKNKMRFSHEILDWSLHPAPAGWLASIEQWPVDYVDWIWFQSHIAGKKRPRSWHIE